jgi:peptidoglycan/LPS O-acetylase OafA/YrhL
VDRVLREQIPSLHGIRALAIAAVVAFHCSRSICPGGFIGVDIFFVLSGFLITRLLVDEASETGKINLLRFYWNRALRLWPALLVMLAAYSALSPVLFPEASAARDVALAGLYLSDYSQVIAGVPDDLIHTWSLSVEEHFYLLWPMVALLVVRSTAAWRRFWILIAAFLLATLWRMVDAMSWQDFATTYYRFDTRLSGLILGAAVAVLPWRPTSRVATAFATTGLLVLLTCSLVLQWRTAAPLLFAGFAVDLASALLVLGVVSHRDGFVARVLATSPLVGLGMISYAVYLWHYPIVRVFRGDEAIPLSPEQGLIVVVGSIGLATLSFVGLERPLRAFRMGKSAGSTAGQSFA